MTKKIEVKYVSKIQVKQTGPLNCMKSLKNINGTLFKFICTNIMQHNITLIFMSSLIDTEDLIVTSPFLHKADRPACKNEEPPR